MDRFYNNQLSAQELQQRIAQQQLLHQQQAQQDLKRQMSMSAQSPGMNHAGQGVADSPMMDVDSLDDIIRDNHEEMQRRLSIPPNFSNHVSPDAMERRMSMMEFGGAGNNFQDFGFVNDTLSANFPDGVGDMGSDMAMANSMSQYGQQQGMLPMGGGSDFSSMTPNVMNSMMPATFASMTMGQVSQNPSSMEMFRAPSITTHFSPNPLTTNGFMDLHLDNDPLSATSANSDLMTVARQPFMDVNAAMAQHSPLTVDMSVGMPSPAAREIPSAASIQSPVRTSNQSTPQNSVSQLAASPAPPPEPKKKNLYSQSGFDMVKALWHVGARKNPEVHLGSVDFSCAFVVCDINMNDCPIIYVSDNFQNLTGYSRHEIVGQNCRFLQAPDGRVEAGTKREFVDDGAVFNLKRKIAEGKEVQQSLINYRKGGKPFLNLLTMIPIPWDTDEIRFFVGFQIDLVECPDAIALGQDPGGVQVNYKHSDMGQYIWTPPAARQYEPDNGQTLGEDDVSTLLQNYNSKGVAASDWHKQSWDKMLLENTDDVVHVVSLKGLFLYLSPSIKPVLGWDVADLLGHPMGGILHPSDLIPVTRELKDATVGTPVSVVYRARMKVSGYVWFDSYGSLFVEQGKGRKCIILVGRPRPIFHLSKEVLEANGGVTESELWSKISTSGLLLYVSSNVQALLDLQPDDLVGTSIQDLMRRETRAEFGRSIEKARRGKIVTCKHEVHNRRGQVLQAQTVLYPGDVSEGQKPTFLLAQTKLLKASSRALAPASPAQRNAAQSSSGASSSLPLTAFTGNRGPQSTDTAARALVSTAAPGTAILPGIAADDLPTDSMFDEIGTTKCTSWQFELRQMEKLNRGLADQLASLLANKKKRKRRKGIGNAGRDCANCHTTNTPEWRRGPSGNRDLCNSCGLRWAKQTGRVSPRNSRGSNSAAGGNADAQRQMSNSPIHSSSLQREMTNDTTPPKTKQEGGDTPGVTAVVDIADSAGNSAVPKGHSMPPLSQPLLEGGSGQEMTSIREEREASAP